MSYATWYKTLFENLASVFNLSALELYFREKRSSLFMEKIRLEVCMEDGSVSTQPPVDWFCLSEHLIRFCTF